MPISPPPATRPSRLTRIWGAVLAPVLALQVRRTGIRSPSLPEAQGPRLGTAGHGPVKLRLLIVGDASAAGVGVKLQTQALAPQLAAHMARHLCTDPAAPCSVSWQLVAASGATAHQALGLMAATVLQPADVLVTALGLNDALKGTPTARWLHDLDTLRSHARNRAKVKHTVHCAPPRVDLMSAVPQPLRWHLGARAARLDAALRRHVLHAFRRSRFVLSLDPRHEDAKSWLSSDGLHPSAELYARWAKDLADHIDLDLAESALQRAAMPSGFHSSGFWGQDLPIGPTVAAAPIERVHPAPRPSVLRSTPLRSHANVAAAAACQAQRQTDDEPVPPPASDGKVVPIGRGRP